MTIECPQCASRYKLDPTKTTKAVVKIKCPKCGNVFSVTLREAEAPAVGHKILVVDDSKFFREMILDVLKPLEMPLLTAGTVEEAMILLRREHPDLVLLDLNLPGKSGYDLIKEVRSDEVLKGIRLLAMSGVFRKEADVAKVELAGADDFINKSFKPEQLVYRVKKLLEQ